MKATVEQLENNKVSLVIEVDESRTDRAMQQASRRLAQRVNIPGFRRGRVPRSLLERHIGREAILQEALEQLWPEVYEEALLETDIEAINVSNVDLVEEFEPGKPLKLKADVEVKPPVTLGEYKGIPVERTVVSIGDSDVDNVLQRFRESQAVLAIPEREIVEEGDFVTVDYEGLADGQPFPGGAADGYELQIGSGQLAPGFGEQLIGAKLGDELEVKVTLPTGYGDMTGKEAMFQVVIREIKERRLPELDDDFAKDVSDFNTLAELRADIRGTMEKQAAEDATAQMRNTVIGEVVNRAEVEVPGVLVERELDDMVENLALNLALRGYDPRRFLEESAEKWREDRHSEAVATVKARLVLEAVAASEGIVVPSEEVETRIEQMAERAGERAEEVRERYRRITARRTLEENLRVEKAMDLIVDAAAVTEKVVDAVKGPEPEKGSPSHDEAQDQPEGEPDPTGEGESDSAEDKAE